ncbi:MAG: ABC transporter permease [Candidatus Methanomethylicia archaeon]
MSFTRYVALRIFQAIPTIIGVVVVMFILVRMLPGDPARLIAGPEASEEDVRRIREILGLNKPLYIQFVEYLISLLRGDLGLSIKFGTPVVNEIMSRLPYTIILAVTAEAIAVATALPLGIISAMKPQSRIGYLSTIVSLLGSSIPIYWMGLVFIAIFAVELRLLPSSGAESPRHLVLPALTLSLLLMGNLTRITKVSVIEALESNYITTARAKGLSERIVILRHGLRNAMIPIVTIMGIQLGALLGGAILTETVFAWPGVGLLLVDSIFYRDYTLIQGIVVFIASMIVAINIIVDVVYVVIDPRVRGIIWGR